MTSSLSFRERLASGLPQFGVRSQLCSATVAEALGTSGCDYVYLDMEHSPNTITTILEQSRALVGSHAIPVVRIAHNDSVVIQQLLDVGIETIVVPMVETAEEAARAVAATRYPPRGERSVARFHRGNAYGNQKDYFEQITDRTCVVAQVESRRAIANIAEIAAVDGVCGLLFGPADLAADMGFLGQNDHPDVVAAIKEAIAVIRHSGKWAGMSSGDAASAAAWIQSGCAFVSVAGDLPLLVREAARTLASARALIV